MQEHCAGQILYVVSYDTAVYECKYSSSIHERSTTAVYRSTSYIYISTCIVYSTTTALRHRRIYIRACFLCTSSTRILTLLLLLLLYGRASGTDERRHRVFVTKSSSACMILRILVCRIPSSRTLSLFFFFTYDTSKFFVCQELRHTCDQKYVCVCNGWVFFSTHS